MEGYKPLKESVCEGLLVRDEEGSVTYPQALDADKTQALMRLFHASTAQQPAQVAAQAEQPGNAGKHMTTSGTSDWACNAL